MQEIQAGYITYNMVLVLTLHCLIVLCVMLTSHMSY